MTNKNNFLILVKIFTCRKNIAKLKNIVKLEEHQKISINPALSDQQCSETPKNRKKINKNIITPDLRNAAKELKNLKEITTKKVDKSNIFIFTIIFLKYIIL